MVLVLVQGFSFLCGKNVGGGHTAAVCGYADERSDGGAAGEVGVVGAWEEEEGGIWIDLSGCESACGKPEENYKTSRHFGHNCCCCCRKDRGKDVASAGAGAAKAYKADRCGARTRLLHTLPHASDQPVFERSERGVQAPILEQKNSAHIQKAGNGITIVQLEYFDSKVLGKGRWLCQIL